MHMRVDATGNRVDVVNELVKKKSIFSEKPQLNLVILSGSPAASLETTRMSITSFCRHAPDFYALSDFLRSLSDFPF